MTCRIESPPKSFAFYHSCIQVHKKILKKKNIRIKTWQAVVVKGGKFDLHKFHFSILVIIAHSIGWLAVPDQSHHRIADTATNLLQVIIVMHP